MQSTNVKQVTQYLREKFEQLEQSNAFARGYQQSMPGNRHSFAEPLDQDILQASLTAERRVQNFRHQLGQSLYHRQGRKFGS
jgi:hypothetical protein